MQLQNIDLLKPTQFTNLKILHPGLQPVFTKTSFSASHLLEIPKNCKTEDPGTTIIQIEETLSGSPIKWEFRYKTLPWQGTPQEQMNLYSEKGQLHSTQQPALIKYVESKQTQEEEWYFDNEKHSDKYHAIRRFANGEIIEAKYCFSETLMKQEESVFENSENLFLNPNTSVEKRITAGLQLYLNTKTERTSNRFLTNNWEGSIFRYYFYISQLSPNNLNRLSINYLENFSTETIYNLAYQIFQNEDIYYLPVDIINSHMSAWFKTYIENHPLTLLEKPYLFKSITST